ncbi:hypothetical protein SteCoe_9292 [Stentor coeruleus]|uniref:LITAF domain-containing protein n=1 Tax=Stentor coeruleus TaxID=5963 RepID=A0A1R2CIG4_9CILI|nr:hypothetical protein SteCoe_9292 [Stentor coeruleus]
MTSLAKPRVLAQHFDDSPLFSFSSRSNSPTITHKISTIPFEFTENTRPGSFVSYQTPATRFSSMSGTNEAYVKLSDDSLIKLHEKMIKIKENYDANYTERPLQLDIPELHTEELAFDEGIPSLRWCAYCGCETATEIYYENSSKTFWSSVAIFFSGGIFGCFMIPYAMKSCKDLHVRCHRCKHKLDRPEAF